MCVCVYVFNGCNECNELLYIFAELLEGVPPHLCMKMSIPIMCSQNKFKRLQTMKLTLMV